MYLSFCELDRVVVVLAFSTHLRCYTSSSLDDTLARDELLDSHDVPKLLFANGGSMNGVLHYCGRISRRIRHRFNSSRIQVP